MGGEIDGFGWSIWLLMIWVCCCCCRLSNDCWETVEDDEGEICCFIDRSVGALVVTGAVLKNC